VKTITKKQKEILDYVKSYHASSGYFPSYREMQDAFQLSSVSTIFKHIQSLKKKGYLKGEKNRWRGLSLLENVIEKNSENIPIIAKIAKGEKLELLSQIILSEIPASFFKSENDTFGLLVKDDTFQDENMQKGDLLIVQEKEPENQDLILASFENKGLWIGRLSSILGEKECEEPLTIHGVIISLLRNYSSSNSSSS